MNTKITQYLDEQQVSYRLLHQSKPTTSIDDTAQERGVEPSQMIKCILLRDMDNNYTLACSSGDQSIDPKKVRAFLQCRRMTCVSIDDVETITGFKVGTVGPLQLKFNLPIIFDHSLKEKNWVTISSGDRMAGIAISMEDLVALSNPKFASINKD
ncbi:YbaK/EbsC family protein [Vibrio makurazakiensis]|uniref:aminoacyl-tRNA deacylase n=1 Tax=Vibrio makurazakiensis TaxID=2910250 RepID=UPI003D14F373